MVEYIFLPFSLTGDNFSVLRHHESNILTGFIISKFNQSLNFGCDPTR